jgi:hypothetical protein
MQMGFVCIRNVFGCLKCFDGAALGAVVTDPNTVQLFNEKEVLVLVLVITATVKINMRRGTDAAHITPPPNRIHLFACLFGSYRYIYRTLRRSRQLYIANVNSTDNQLWPNLWGGTVNQTTQQRTGDGICTLQTAVRNNLQ